MASLMQLTGLVLVIVYISETAAADAQLDISVSNWSPVQGESFTVICSLLRTNADGVGWQIRYYKHNEDVVETICTFDSRRETKETEPWRCDLYANPNSDTIVMEAKIDNITESYTGIVWCETHTPLRRNKSECVFVKTDKGAGKVISRTDETSTCTCSICLYWIVPAVPLVVVVTLYIIWRTGLAKKCGLKGSVLDAQAGNPIAETEQPPHVSDPRGHAEQADQSALRAAKEERNAPNAQVGAEQAGLLQRDSAEQNDHMSAHSSTASINLHPPQLQVVSGISDRIEGIKGLTINLRNGEHGQLADQIDNGLDDLYCYIKTGQKVDSMRPDEHSEVGEQEQGNAGDNKETS